MTTMFQILPYQIISHQKVIDSITAIGINIYVNETQFAKDGGDEYTTPCQTDLEATSLNPLFTEKELRVTLY